MNGDQSFKPDDLESAISSTRRHPRFRDFANIAVENDFHAELKRKLKQEVDSYGLEKYRKPLSEIKQMKNKKIKAFYEAQNDRLNDWLEVDSLVMNMADDVLDSMNPQDADGDGIAEEGGKLMETAGDISPLLPEDERERRRVGEKRARWAINVGLTFRTPLYNAKSTQLARCRQPSIKTWFLYTEAYIFSARLT